jgi:predicted nucleotide-binding protein (sugar kinase/HSP70/actin superfamily)
MRKDIEKLIEDITEEILTTSFKDYSTLVDAIEKKLENKGFTKGQIKELRISIYGRIKQKLDE